VVARCSYPLTAIACVRRIYTDLATLECTSDGLKLVDTRRRLGLADLQDLVGLTIAPP